MEMEDDIAEQKICGAGEWEIPWIALAGRQEQQAATSSWLELLQRQWTQQLVE